MQKKYVYGLLFFNVSLIIILFLSLFNIGFFTEEMTITVLFTIFIINVIQYFILRSIRKRNTENNDS